MTAIEFLNFYAMFLIALIVTRALQILLRNTWVSPALGALHQ
jgi:hypothetical protein